MLFNENISPQFYEEFVTDGLRTHNSLVFFSGSEISISEASMIKTAKTICAFANVGGGDIVYGIKSKSGRAYKLEPILNFNKTSDWLFHELQSYIDKPVRDLQIKVTELEDNSKIIHFYIPTSNNQPHMFADNRYYRLHNSKPVVLEEAEVRMLYGNISVCDLEFLGVYNTNGLPILSAGKFVSVSFYPKFLIRNSGNIVEKDYKIEISFPAKLYEESFQPLQSLFIRHEGIHAVFGQKGIYPLFQHEISTMIDAKIQVTTKNIDTFLSEYININLYFSNGIKKHRLKLSDTLTYNGKQLKKEDFVDIKLLDI
jgi:hypothetical protein